jgi:cation transport regulator ChaB
MPLPQCKAIVTHGRDAKGNRSGLVVPRICQRVAKHGDYCGLHAKQAELHDLYRECFGYGWEYKAEAYQRRQRRAREKEGRKVAESMAMAASELQLNDLAFFLRRNRIEVAKVWADSGE